MFVALAQALSFLLDVHAPPGRGQEASRETHVRAGHRCVRVRDGVAAIPATTGAETVGADVPALVVSRSTTRYR